MTKILFRMCEKEQATLKKDMFKTIIVNQGIWNGKFLDPLLQQSKSGTF